MSALVWGVKASLLDYVRGRGRGSVELSGGATAFEGAIRFPGDARSFRGTVTLTAHGGMLRIVIADPALVESPSGWLLEIADPDDPTERLPFATIAAFDGTRASGTALTEAGADLFFGPYSRGTPLDDPVVEAE